MMKLLAGVALIGGALAQVASGVGGGGPRPSPIKITQWSPGTACDTGTVRGVWMGGIPPYTVSLGLSVTNPFWTAPTNDTSISYPMLFYRVDAGTEYMFAVKDSLGEVATAKGVFKSCTSTADDGTAAVGPPATIVMQSSSSPSSSTSIDSSTTEAAEPSSMETETSATTSSSSSSSTSSNPAFVAAKTSATSLSTSQMSTSTASDGSTKSAAPSSSATSKHSSNIGVIAGVVVGIIVLLLLLAAAAFFVLRRRRAKSMPTTKLEPFKFDDEDIMIHYRPPPSTSNAYATLPSINTRSINTHNSRPSASTSASTPTPSSRSPPTPTPTRGPQDLAPLLLLGASLPNPSTSSVGYASAVASSVAIPPSPHFPPPLLPLVHVLETARPRLAESHSRPVGPRPQGSHRTQLSREGIPISEMGTFASPQAHRPQLSDDMEVMVPQAGSTGSEAAPQADWRSKEAIFAALDASPISQRRSSSPVPFIDIDLGPLPLSPMSPTRPLHPPPYDPSWSPARSA